jgi:hypothetical protein
MPTIKLEDILKPGAKLEARILTDKKVKDASAFFEKIRIDRERSDRERAVNLEKTLNLRMTI